MPWWGYVIIAAVLIIIGTILIVTGNGKKVKAWLQVAVAAAEKELGPGTGPAKLEKVYNEFTEKFPKISTILPYSLFCKLVDKALKVLNKILAEEKESN